MEKNVKNHPYMSKLEETLSIHKRKLELLEKRMSLIDDHVFHKSAFEQNEAEITKINTLREIESLKAVIKERESYFIKFMQQYIEDLDEVESNFDSLINEAKGYSQTNDKLKALFSKINWDNLNKNTESKIYFYKEIKKIVSSIKNS